MHGRGDLVWLRGELPWLDTGFLPSVPSGRLDLALQDLGKLGFKVFLLNGDRMNSAAECYAEVTRVFGFWGNWQGNPDAFRDFIGDVELSRRAAILWTSTRTLAAVDPIAFARVISLLMLTREEISPDVCQVEIFIGE
jgi:hypothetical protein